MTKLTWNTDMSAAEAHDGDVLLIVHGELRVCRWFAPWGVWMDTIDSISTITEYIDYFGIGQEVPTAWLPANELLNLFE